MSLTKEQFEVLSRLRTNPKDLSLSKTDMGTLIEIITHLDSQVESLCSWRNLIAEDLLQELEKAGIYTHADDLVMSVKQLRLQYQKALEHLHTFEKNVKKGICND